METTTAAVPNPVMSVPNGASGLSAPMTQDVIVHADRAASVWSKERVEIIKKTVCPKGIPDDDFALFLEQCKRTALDPLIKEAFCIPRNVNIGTKDRPNWVVKYDFQPSEAGMAARADRFSDFGGIRCGVVYEGDVCDIDESNGTVAHKSSPIGRVGKKILGAWSYCIRSGRALPVEWCDLDAYDSGQQQWSSKKATMIAKCARAAAYRRAYPNVFGGLYIEEESVDEVEVNPAPQFEEREGKTRTESVADKVRARAAEGRVAPTPPPPPASGQTVDAEKPRPAPVMLFGGKEFKGKLVCALTTNAIADLIASGDEKIAEALVGPDKPKWFAEVSQNVADLRAEFSKRELEFKAGAVSK